MNIGDSGGSSRNCGKNRWAFLCPSARWLYVRDALLNYYGRRAGEYEAIYAKPERQVDLASLKCMLQSELAGHRILELACGTGYWTAAIAETAEFVLATDQNEAVLELAREKRLPPAKVTFLRADAYMLDGLPKNLTAIFAGFWLSHVPRQEVKKFLQSIATFLPDGSPIVFIDNRFVEGSSSPISYMDVHGNTYQIRKLLDGSSHRVLKNFPTTHELLGMTEAHFDNVAVVEFEYFWLLKGLTKSVWSKAA
jgi:ubiquinone/menaquinone biosynthesis C-methylase UbiE